MSTADPARMSSNRPASVDSNDSIDLGDPNDARASTEPQGRSAEPVTASFPESDRTDGAKDLKRLSTSTLESDDSRGVMEPVSLGDDNDEAEHDKVEESRLSGTSSTTPSSIQHAPSISTGSRLGFLPSAFGFGVSRPSVSPVKSPEPGRSPIEHAIAGPSRSSSAASLTPPARNQSPVEHDKAGSSWTSSITNYFGSKSPSMPSPLPSIPSPFQPSKARPNTERSTSGSTAFILQKLDATKEERRRSVKSGGSEALREEFERVKLELERGLDRKRDSARIRDAAAFGDPTDLDDDDGKAFRKTMDKGKMVSVQEDGPIETANDDIGADGIDWSFWGSVMNDYEGVARNQPKDLTKAIQQGIPAVIRGTIWQLMSSSKSPELEATYARLLKTRSPHEKAIQKDLARTLPGHRYFAQGGGIGQENLFNVVKAYSLHDTEVGYTQGLAFIVAALLLNMPDEEAFCVLVRLMETYNLRTHFLPEMPGLQLRMFQFDRLLEELLPALHLHLVKKGIKSSMYASTWFLTLFTHRFPLSLVYRIFDIVFAEGIEAIFRFSLALMRRNEEALLKLGFEGILKFVSSEIFDCYKTDAPPADEFGSPVQDDSEWLANEFVRDAYATSITPFMLDSYASEWEELCRAANAQAIEMDNLRSTNRVLSAQVKQLEGAMSAMSIEHVEMVKQLVEARIEKEALEAELIRYKTLYAEAIHAQDTSRASYVAPSEIRRSPSTLSVPSQAASVVSMTTTAPFHLTLMREALSYSYLCEVSPTAFSVGSIIFFPRKTSPAVAELLSSLFAPVDREGLILSQGYSRQLPGNTHAEANAINTFVEHARSIPKDTVVAIAKASGLGADATADDVIRSILAKSWIYATMEPCSKRTSGLKDCTAEIIDWGLKRVYMGVREPPDYVQCEGVRLLRDAGVEVVCVQGMEEECLVAARRGL